MTAEVLLQQLHPMVDTLVDAISSVGFGIGLSTAIYLREMRHEPSRNWLPFVALAIVFGLFGAEGGWLDPFAPGVVRIIALIVLIVAELLGAYAVIKPHDGPVDVP